MKRLKWVFSVLLVFGMLFFVGCSESEKQCSRCFGKGYVSVSCSVSWLTDCVDECPRCGGSGKQ